MQRITHSRAAGEMSSYLYGVDHTLTSRPQMCEGHETLRDPLILFSGI